MFQYMEVEEYVEAFVVVPKSFQGHKGVLCLKPQRIIAVVCYILAES